jgi:hypothetical protein
MRKAHAARKPPIIRVYARNLGERGAATSRRRPWTHAPAPGDRRALNGDPMRRLTKILVLVGAVALSGCASTGSKSGGAAASADTLRACERIVYWSADAPRDQALHCADVLGLWR